MENLVLPDSILIQQKGVLWAGAYLASGANLLNREEPLFKKVPQAS